MPSCATGFHCDTSNGTCVSDGNPDGGGDAQAAGCDPACSGGTPFCNAMGHCVSCLTDGNCPLGTTCKQINDMVASCVRGCTTDDRCKPDGGASTMGCCAGSCVDTAIDPTNCGSCGKVCTTPHSTATCAASACTAGGCDNGWGDCNNDPKDGCETNLHLDTANCTMCGMGCDLANAHSACSDGCYISACNFGYDDCNIDPSDGCEVQVLADTNNCGSCGKLCKGLPHASANCTDGNCVLGTCDPGYFDCNNMPLDGCESNIGGDANNCGACGKVCGGNLVCKNGGCTCPMCNFPNAASSCVNNVCIMGACVQGFADCNNSPNDGCEVNINSDKNNCNGCGKVCPNNTPFCSMGTCVLAPTLVGQFIVNAGPAWGGNPPCYTCQEACALLFGGMATDYSCSTVNNMVNHQAYEDGWGDSQHCGMNPVAENYKLNVNYNCGMMSCSFSAYVNDHGCNSTNYCFK
jgi:hypothetical protein